jgi:hypothetical protein
MKEDIEAKDEKDELETQEPPKRQPDVVAREELKAAESVESHEETRSPREAAERDQSDGLFDGDRATELRRRWSEIQARFVDDPREAVKAADTLVDEVIRDLTALFADERAGLESHWDRNEKISTEDLRVALRRYRSFFERLLVV